MSNNKPKFWILGGFTISIFLFCFMFTYWGNHGFGDSARVPLGYFKVMKQINANDTYIEDGSGSQIAIKRFITDGRFLYAEVDNDFIDEGHYFVIWDLKSNMPIFYNTRAAYQNARMDVPDPSTFIDFQTFYSAYWHGWRFYLLP